MLTKRIIPCLDVDQGRVVKGVSFLNLKDAGDPSDMASFYDREGADELVFLDITATSDGRKTMVNVVENVSEQVFIPLTVGGGIRSVKDIRQMLEAGADKVSINTAAVMDPRLISEASDFFGSQCIVVAIDIKPVSSVDSKVSNGTNADLSLSLDSNSLWEVHTHGGRNPTGIDALKWSRTAARLGAGELLVTSMATDGQLSGYDIEPVAAISKSVHIPVIASGGAGTLHHFYDALVHGKADAVLAASVFHYGKYRISDAKTYLSGRGVPIRPTLAP